MSSRSGSAEGVGSIAGPSLGATGELDTKWVSVPPAFCRCPRAELSSWPNSRAMRSSDLLLPRLAAGNPSAAASAATRLSNEATVEVASLMSKLLALSVIDCWDVPVCACGSSTAQIISVLLPTLLVEIISASAPYCARTRSMVALLSAPTNLFSSIVFSADPRAALPHVR